MRLGLTVAALVLLAACDGEPEEDPCAETLAALRVRLESYAARAEPPGAPDWVPLPEGAGVPLEGAGPLLVVSPDDIELDGRGVGGADDDEAAEALAHDLRSWASAARLDEDAELQVAVWTSADTTVGRLAAVARSSPPSARFALLVRAAREDEEVPEWIGEAFAPDSVGRPRVRRQRIERAWRRATHRCEPARSHLVIGGGLEAAGPAAGRPSVEGLMDALAECGCESTGLATIEQVASRALVPPEGPVLRLAPSVRFGPATDQAPELTFEPDDTVAELRDRLPSGAVTVWVRVD